MTKQLLFGTHNQSKIKRIQTVTKDLPIQIRNLRDLQITQEPQEDGKNVRENALKKARYYHEKSGMPTFSIDSGLYIDRFSDDKQPGVFVRRINGEKATDEEMIAYYSRELKKVGGESKGKWISAIAFVMNEENVKTYELVEERFFTSDISPVINKGLPLGSMSIDPVFNKYVSEITEEERRQLQGKSDKQLYGIFADIFNN